MTCLPGNWVEVPLGEVAALNPKHPSDLDRSTAVSFVPMPAVDAKSGEINSAVDRELGDVWSGFTHFADGDVIFAKITPCMENGKIALAEGLTNGLACGSTEFHVLRPSSGVLPVYLWRFLRQQTFRDDAEQAMTGAVGQRRVPADFIRRSLLPLPPLAGQRRIVAKLDSLTARTASARSELDRVLPLAARYKQAFLGALFRRDRADAKDWTWSRLGDVAHVGTGATPKRGDPRFWDNGTIPWVTSGAVNNQLVTEPDGLITETALRDTNCRIYPAGTLLVAMYGEGQTRGRVTCLGIAAATNQALAAIQVRPDDPVSAPFLLWFLRHQYLELRDRAAGGVQPNLNLGILKDVRVPTPPPSEQARLVALAEAACSENDRLAAEAAAARGLLDRLDQAILAKAFRGELVPQDPADEPASVLLDRVRAERAAAPAQRRGRKAKAP